MRDGFTVFDGHMHYGGIFKDKNQTFIEYLDENGIDKAVVNTLNTTANLGRMSGESLEGFLKDVNNPDFELFKDFRTAGQPSHKEVDRIMQKNPGRIFPFFWYNPNDPNDPDQQKGLSILERELDKGYKGVKLQLAMTPCEIEQLYPAAEMLIERKLPMYIHPSGGCYSAPRTLPRDIAKLAKKYKNLKIIVGHSSYTMEFAIESVFAFMEHKNIFFETSVSIAFGTITFVKMFGPRRVIFGSDCPTAGPFQLEFEKVKLLNIPEKSKQLIYSRNLERLLRTK